MKFRDLTKNEIDVRIGAQNEKGITLLLYKNARVDMDILDETVGAENWQREHYECKGNLFCRVGIKTKPTVDMKPNGIEFDGNAWVWKSDCGTESNTEKEKGEASDSFKRACVNWGIGRELYTSPFIWIPANADDSTENYKLDKNNKCRDKFIVQKIIIEDKKITALAVYNTKLKKTVFTWQASPKKSEQGEPAAEKLSSTHINALKELAKRKGVTTVQLQKKYKVRHLEEMSMADYTTCVNGLQKMEDKQ